MISRARLDGMTDGVFAFAMTLLVVTLDVPDGYAPADMRDHLAFLASLGDAFLAYLISFVVLGTHWMKLASDDEGSDPVPPAHAWTRLAGLFLVTLMPFSTVLVARYGEFWPSIWIYSANLIASGCLYLRARQMAARERGTKAPAAEAVDTGVLIGTALLAAVIGLVDPTLALWTYLLNLGGPLLVHLSRRRTA